MKAKNCYSPRLLLASAKGAMALLVIISTFLAFFVMWSFSCIGGAFVNTVKMLLTG